MLDYSLVQALAAVVREGSFERAARALHVTPSAVSQRVKLLEERLGAVLVVRGQPCTATALGARLCVHAEHVGALEHDLEDALARAHVRLDDVAIPTLRVAVNADSLGTWFVDAWRRFAAEEVALLDVSVDDQEHTADALRRGQVLAAVTASADPVQGCRAVPLGALEYVATASPDFVARWFPRGVQADALTCAPTLIFNTKDRLQERWVRERFDRDVPLHGHRLPSTQGFVDAALAGIGWGMNPRLLVDAHLRAGRLVELVPGHGLAVPLHWQTTRLAIRLLDRLTACVRAQAAQALTATGSPAPPRTLTRP